MTESPDACRCATVSAHAHFTRAKSAGFLLPHLPWNRFSALLLALSLVAAGGAKLPDNFDTTAIDAHLSGLMKQGNRVGLSIAIVKDGKTVLQKGYGRRSVTDARPVDSETLFAIGSVSKQFTCVSVLLLAEEGKLSVQDPVSKYYPSLARAGDITLLDLMNHVSGYPDYYPLDFVDRRMQQPIDEDELLRRYAGGALDFEPGSKYSYSNTGYILLGRVVEKVSGGKFGDFLSRRFFQPLGMTHTGYELDPADARIARGHTTFALSPPEPVAPEARGWIAAAGGIYSTPGDLAKWNLALHGGRVLKPESYALMTAPRRLSNGRISDYGCGLSVRTQGGRQFFSHSGAVSGFNTWSATIPSTRSTLILICNLDGGLGSLPNQIFGLLLKEPSLVPVIAGAPATETAKEIFAQFQRGRVDRTRFADEFNHFLSGEKLDGAAKRLRAYGNVRQAELLGANERGGLEVTTTRLTFSKGELKVLMYRKPDGRIEQFFVSAD